MTAHRDIDCEYYLMADDQARLLTSNGDYPGRPNLGAAARKSLRLLEHVPDEYGEQLCANLFPPAAGRTRHGTGGLWEGYRECRMAAGRDGRVHFRLHLAANLGDEIRALHWEWLRDPQKRETLARSPRTPFSRYTTGKRGLPLQGRPRLLVAVADPTDAAHHHLPKIDRPRIEETLGQALDPLVSSGTLVYEIFQGPVTASGLKEKLQQGRFHILHLVAHGGIPFNPAAVLVLQSSDGLAHMLPEETVADLVLGNHDLRLVTLVTCDSGRQADPEDAFSGLAGRLVHRGIPAVIAMTRRISVDAGACFAEHFYRHLLPDGLVDVATNAARERISLDPALEPLGWSTPVLFMRPLNPRIWYRAWPRVYLVIALVMALVLAYSPSVWRSFLSSPEDVAPVVDSPATGAPPIDPPPPTPQGPGEDAPSNSPPPDSTQPSRDEPLPVEFQRCLEDANAYRKAGGANVEESLRLYRRVLEELPDAYLRRLDRQLLDLANQEYNARSYVNAARCYHELFQKLTEDSDRRSSRRLPSQPDGG